MTLSLLNKMLFAMAVWTILLSVFLHGFSALLLARWYAGGLKTASPSIPELVDVPDLEPVQNRLDHLHHTLAP